VSRLPQTCPKCDATNSQADTLRRHLKRYHPEREEQVQEFRAAKRPKMDPMDGLISQEESDEAELLMVRTTATVVAKDQRHLKRQLASASASVIAAGPTADFDDVLKDLQGPPFNLSLDVARGVVVATMRTASKFAKIDDWQRPMMSLSTQAMFHMWAQLVTTHYDYQAEKGAVSCRAPTSRSSSCSP